MALSPGKKKLAVVRSEYETDAVNGDLLIYSLEGQLLYEKKKAVPIIEGEWAGRYADMQWVDEKTVQFLQNPRIQSWVYLDIQTGLISPVTEDRFLSSYAFQPIFSVDQDLVVYNNQYRSILLHDLANQRITHLGEGLFLGISADRTQYTI